MIDFTLDTSVGFWLNRTAIQLKRELLRAFHDNGHTVTAEQWALLNRLWEEEGLSQVELAERTFNDKPNVTRMLAVLERNGFVHRKQNEQDRRAFQVLLTPEGWRLRGELVPLAERVLERALDGLGAEDIGHLKRILDHIDARLSAMQTGTAAD